jgi:hypothetical protein
LKKTGASPFEGLAPCSVGISTIYWSQHIFFSNFLDEPLFSPIPLPARRAYRPEGRLYEPEANIPLFSASGG